MNNKNFILITIILSVVAVFGLISYLSPKFNTASEAKMENFPKFIGEWKGEDIALSDRDYEILETRNLIVRDYKNDKGELVNLYIIYSGDNRKVAHPPEICYTGSGANIIEKSVIGLTNSIQANKFVIEIGDSRELVVYWFKSKDLSTYSYFKQQLKIVTDRMFGKRTSGAMIRISTVIKNKDQQAALSLINSFCNQIEPLIPTYIP